MYARIFLNKVTQSTTDGVVFNEVRLSLRNSSPVAEGEVKSLKELKAMAKTAISASTENVAVSVSIITRGRSVNGFNAWYNALPQCIPVSTVNELTEFK